MRIETAQVQNYRSIRDSDPVDIESDKTILVGINESGKTALLKGILQASPSQDAAPVDWLYDAPAAIVDDIRRGNLKRSDLKVATVTLKPEPRDIAGLGLSEEEADAIRLVVTSDLDNKRTYEVIGLGSEPTTRATEKAVVRLAAAMGKMSGTAAKDVSARLTAWREKWPRHYLRGEVASSLQTLLDEAVALFADGSAAETHWEALRSELDKAKARSGIQAHLISRVPPFVYFSSYFAVRPRIHLDQLATREEANDLDLAYDFGNLQLLKFLGFTARELSDMDSDPPTKGHNFDTNVAEQERYQTELAAHERRVSERKKALYAAAQRLTQEIRKVWNDDTITLRLEVDRQYLMTLVEDSSGFQVELDQRSDGFRWLVSFFVVFHAQAGDNLKDAVLLLDEPGLSLHALKQQEFRKTVSRLAEGNQIVYTTHSPFMVGSDELDLVRIVELDRESGKGTKVHTRLAVEDPKSIYPLQAALGYDLAQSMFTHKRNLVVEGVTDLLYIEALNAAFAADNGPSLDDGTAIVPAGSASKVVYYSTILTSQDLKVAALLDSDAGGDQAAEQEALWQLLSSKRILRTGDHVPSVKRSEFEDLIRTTLAIVARDELGWDSVQTITDQPNRPIMEILAAEHESVSKWKLARKFTRWLADNGTEALTDDERVAWASLASAANNALA